MRAARSGAARAAVHRRCYSTEVMSHFLAFTNHETRARLRHLFGTDPAFIPKYNLALDAERDLAYQRLKKVCDLGVVSVRDFLTNPRNIFAVHEMCGQCDGNLATKFTVQFNLFGGTVLKLGTDKHHALLCDAIDSLQRVGCFGLTELGYGNNAVEMETTATYDPETDEFVVHTPTPQAQKYWITNGAVHAHYCVVFARLILPGGEDEGLHGFLVPIRSEEDRSVKPNVQVWDMGYKIGLNGIDNAALWFNSVRVPRDALLDQTSQVAKGGAFTSSIEDGSKRKRKRFLRLADQLLSGRVCIASMVIGSTQMVLATTVKYSCSRLAVGPTGLSDTPIMKYQLQRNTIMPLIATTYALKIALNHVQRRYHESSMTTDEEEKKTLVRLCCIIKPLVAWHAERTATVCRERCGGQGFLAANRFGEAIVGAHAGITAEGDNRVMQLKVATELLLAMKPTAASIAAHVVRKRLSFWPLSGRPTDLAWQRRVFKARLDRSLNDLAVRFAAARSKKTPVWETVMRHESDLIQTVGNAYGENMVAEACAAALSSPHTAAELKPTLEKLVALWGLERLRADACYLAEEGLLAGGQLQRMADAQRALCEELGDDAEQLVAGFGIPQEMHHEPIANSWVTYNSGSNPFGELDNQAYRASSV
eukprot:TRINITY_DN11601_c0_g1_i1.p1 TRINITY_DN11601_c0_g1~~TRINITY_DN11601_c0_g1_i1.p1  ORF type:complete len:650 (+),score=260.04 TRINITY_DN11601_c0_g1_i1:60-2009(+)